MKALTLKNKKTLLPVVLVLAGLAVPLVITGQYALLILDYILIYLVAVSGFDVLVGFTGQMSMGHAAYFCIGAYGSALLHQYTDIPVFFTMIIATVASTIIGTLIAWPTTKLVAHFMSLATIAFGQIVFQIVYKSPNRITGDANGMTTVPLDLFGFQVNTYLRFYYFGFVILIAVLLLKNNLLHSKIGRAMLAIRENDHAADGMGVNVRVYKVIAFSISTFCVSYAGAMYAHLVKYISPDSFRQTVSVMFVTMLLFGGSSSIAGPFIGVAAVTLLNEALRAASSYKMLVYGVLLLLVIVAFPGGLYGLFNDLRAKWTLRAGKRKAADTTCTEGTDDAEG